MDTNLKREIILEHYQNPIHRGLLEEEGYVKVNMNNDSCIDDITLMVKFAEDRIQEIHFEAEACAISTATTSIMIKLLEGKSVEEAQEIIKNYEAMINEEEYDASLLGEANAFDDVAKQPSRKKCALLSWWGMKEAIEKR